jgi:hypothetical protein
MKDNNKSSIGNNSIIDINNYSKNMVKALIYHYFFRMLHNYYNHEVTAKLPALPITDALLKAHFDPQKNLYYFTFFQIFSNVMHDVLVYYTQKSPSLKILDNPKQSIVVILCTNQVISWSLERFENMWKAYNIAAGGNTQGDTMIKSKAIKAVCVELIINTVAQVMTSKLCGKNIDFVQMTLKILSTTAVNICHKHFVDLHVHHVCGEDHYAKNLIKAVMTKLLDYYVYQAAQKTLEHGLTMRVSQKG